MESPLSDEALLAQAVSFGDGRAFDELVRRHHGVVRSVLLRSCRDPDLADDIAQETFMQAFQNLKRFRGDGSFRGWLCAIAARRLIDHVRRRDARRRAEANAEDVAPAVAGLDGAAVDLDKAMSELSAPERLCISLAFGAGMSHTEIADAADLPLGTVKSHIVRGREKLKARLQGWD